MSEQAHDGPRMSGGPAGGNGKAALYARLAQFKRGALVASLAAFAALAGLAAEHQVGSGAAGAAGTQTTAPAASQQAPSNGYFDQSGSDTQGGYGIDQSPAQQAPITGSSAS